MVGRPPLGSGTATTRPGAPPRRRTAAKDGGGSRTGVGRGWITGAALLVSVALWLLSLRHVSLDQMRDLGLLQVLPVLFWAALALLTLSFCLALGGGRTRQGWLAAHVLVLIAVLHATPALLYPTLRYAWAWKHVAVVDAMLRHGGDVPAAGRLSVYNDWPGFFELNALFLRATGLESAVGYAGWAPPVVNALLLAPLLLLYRSVTSDHRLVWGAVWIFYICSWVGQDYFAPQAFSFLLFLTVIALVLRNLPSSQLRSPGSRPGAWRPGLLLAVLVMEAAIVVSHPLTPLMLISALVVLSLPRRNRRVTLPALAGAVVFTAVWDSTVARSYISANFDSFLQALVRPETNVSAGLAELGNAAPGQVVVAWVDRGLSAAVLALAAVAVVRRPWVRRTGLPLLAVAPLPVLTANAYGGEMIFRAYLFALPPAALLISALIVPSVTRDRLRTPVVYPVLLAMLGAMVFGYYGKEAVNRFSREEVAAARFATAQAPPGSRIVTLTPDVAGIDMYYDRHEQLSLSQQTLRDRQRLVRDPLAGVETFVARATDTRPAYIVLTRAQAADCYLTGVLPADTVRRVDAALSDAAGFTRVYRNDDAVVYRYVGPPAGGR